MELRDDWSPGSIRLAERPTPEPGPGQVLLRMQAAALNYRDFVLVNGGYGRRGGELPLVPVSDGAGEVVATGDGVSQFAVGDLVCPAFSQNWPTGPFSTDVWDGILGGPLDGVMQDYMVLEEDGVVAAPKHLSAVQAAALPCAAVTAWNAIVTQGQVQSGDVVVVLGTGGVSLFALQFAKLQGAEVVVTSSSDERLARAGGLGADHGINYVDEPIWSRVVREITDGAGADHVVEVGGAGTLEQSIRSVRPSGTISLIGVLAGRAGEVDLAPVLAQNIRLQGVTVGSRAVFQDMARAMEEHKIEPVIAKRSFLFEEVGQAIAAFPGGGHFGKVCAEFEA